MKLEKVSSIALKVALVILVIGIVSAGCGGPVADVKVAKVGPRAIEETVMVAGSLQATEPVQVMPQVYGSVEQVCVDEGQEVLVGQTLVQLNTDSLEQSLLSAKASLESARSLSSMFSSLSSSAASIGSSVNAAIANMNAGMIAAFDFLKSLIPSLPEEYQPVAEEAWSAAYAAYSSNRPSGMSVSSGGGGVSTAAQQAAARKSIENAEKNLQAATIRAPITGTVLRTEGGGASLESMMGTLMSSFSGMMPAGLDLSALTSLGGFETMGMPSSGDLVPGSVVMPGSPVYTIVDLKSMTMVAKVDESDIAKIAENQVAAVSLEAYPDREFNGTVVHVADTATTNEAGATAFDVEIQMDPSDINLKLGMTGTADLVVATREATVVVPVKAIVEKKGKKYVFKVVDGKAELTEVKLGLVTPDRVEIVDGLEIGDRVVEEGVEKLKDGQGVKVD